MSKKATWKKQKHRKPIVCADFDDVCSDIFEDGKLSLNSDCMHLLRKSIHMDGYGYSKRHTFEVFSALLNADRDRKDIISEIVASWWHLNYDAVRRGYCADLDTGDQSREFLLRNRRLDERAPPEEV